MTSKPPRFYEKNAGVFKAGTFRSITVQLQDNVDGDAVLRVVEDSGMTYGDMLLVAARLIAIVVEEGGVGDSRLVPDDDGLMAIALLLNSLGYESNDSFSTETTITH